MICQGLPSFPAINLTDILNSKIREQALLAIILFPLRIIFLYTRYDPHPDMSPGQRQGDLSQVWS